MKNHRRALRRAQAAKTKQTCRKFLSWSGLRPDDPGFERAVGMRARTPKNCSCWMCGNPRRHARDGRTLQERRAGMPDAMDEVGTASE